MFKPFFILFSTKSTCLGDRGGRRYSSKSQNFSQLLEHVLDFCGKNNVYITINLLGSLSSDKLSVNTRRKPRGCTIFFVASSESVRLSDCCMGQTLRLLAPGDCGRWCGPRRSRQSFLFEEETSSLRLLCSPKRHMTSAVLGFEVLFVWMVLGVDIEKMGNMNC